MRRAKSGLNGRKKTRRVSLSATRDDGIASFETRLPALLSDDNLLYAIQRQTVILRRLRSNRLEGRTRDLQPC